MPRSLVAALAVLCAAAVTVRAALPSGGALNPRVHGELEQVNSLTIDLSGSFSLCTFAKLGPAYDYDIFMGMGDRSTGNGLYIGTGPSGFEDWIFGMWNIWRTYDLDTNTAFGGDWVHLCGTFSTANGPRFYVNGVALTSVGGGWTTEAFGGSALGTGRLYIGGCAGGECSEWGASQDPTFDGLLDETMVWERELTPAEVAAVAAGGSPPDGDLVVYLTYDDLSGTIAAATAPTTEDFRFTGTGAASWGCTGGLDELESATVACGAPGFGSRDETCVNGVLVGASCDELNPVLDVDAQGEIEQVLDSTIDLSGSFSLSAWIKKSSTTTDLDNIFGMGERTTGNGLYLGVPWSDGNALFGMWSIWRIYGSAGVFNTDWQHVVGTFSVANGPRFYVDGAEVASSGSPTTLWESQAFGGSLLGTKKLYIGGFAGGSPAIANGDDPRFRGLIDSVTVLQREISAAEVTELYTTGELSDTSSTVVRLTFDGASGTDVPDLSEAGNNYTFYRSGLRSFGCDADAGLGTPAVAEGETVTGSDGTEYVCANGALAELAPKQCAGTAPATPTLVSSSISASGDLVVSFEAEGDGRYTKVGWQFPGADAATCDDADGDQAELWSLAVASGSCPDTHTLTVPLTAALNDCGFSAEPQDGGNFWFYETVLEATTVEDAGSVFGDDQTRTTVTSFRLRVELPKSVAVNASATVFGAVIDQAALTEQTFNAFTQEFGWNLATSVQYPYYLEPVSTAVAGHTFDTLPVVVALGDNDCSETGTDGAPAACRQEFALSANETDDCRLTNAQVTTTFQILCRPQYAGSCDLPEGNTTTATFFVTTDDFCPQVVEVASITPALTTYSDSDRTSVSTNYILETTLFARVTADIEAGLQALRTTLTGLDIASSCTGCSTPLVQPFTDTSAAATAYGFAYVAGGTDNSATGEVETDFSFTLNTNSLSFDNDASTGEAQITLTAYVSVEYDTPSAQGLARSYRVQAVSSGSVGSSATAQASVSSPSAGGASSTAGSSVFGVSAGVVVAAVLGLAAVAAVAVGVATAARRARPAFASRKAAGSTAASSSSAALSLEMAAAEDEGPNVPGAVGAVPTDDLETVRSAYV